MEESKEREIIARMMKIIWLSAVAGLAGLPTLVYSKH
jgi:hypothetical protein